MHRSRRLFLTDLGKTTLGLVVFGAACTTDDPVVEAPTATMTPDPDAPPMMTEDPMPTEAAPTEEATGEAAATEEPAAGGALEVATVDLDFVAAYVVARAGEAAVIDTGVAGSEPAIEEVLSAAGLGWGAVGHVIVTHNHPDHMGSLAAVADLAADAALYGGAADIPAMTAPREIAAVGDGDTVFDLAIIETPGHTAGHLSVHDPAGGLLFAGDALNGDGGMLIGPNPEFSADMGMANASVAKLAELPVDQVFVCHGFPVTAGAEELRALASAL